MKNVLICGGMGQGLQHRLKRKGIQAIATAETDPDRAVAAWLLGTLKELPAERHDHFHHPDAGHAHHRDPPLTGSRALSMLSVEQLFSTRFKEST